MQIIYQLPAKHPSAVPAVLWMQDSPQCRNWVTLQRWCAARTLGRVFLPYKSSIVFGDELWMLPRSWGELWKVDCLLCLSHLFWKGLDFQVDFTSFFLGGRESRNCHWQKKTLRSLPWSWLRAVMSFIDCTPPQVSSFYESLVKYLTFILCVIQKTYFAKKKKKNISDSIDFSVYLGVICEDLCFSKGSTWWTSTISSERWRSWTSKKRLDFVVEKCLGVVFYQSVEVNLSWRLICQQTNKKVKSFDPFFFGVADDAALCAGDVELIEIEGPILRLEMQGGHPSILPSRSASVCRGGEHLLCMNLCKYVECRNSMNNDIK